MPRSGAHTGNGAIRLEPADTSAYVTLSGQIMPFGAEHAPHHAPFGTAVSDRCPWQRTGGIGTRPNVLTVSQQSLGYGGMAAQNLCERVRVRKPAKDGVDDHRYLGVEAFTQVAFISFPRENSIKDVSQPLPGRAFRRCYGSEGASARCSICPNVH